MADPVLRHAFAVGSIVTVVDAVNGARTLDAHEEAVRQGGLRRPAGPVEDRPGGARGPHGPARAARRPQSRRAVTDLTLDDDPEAALLTDDPTGEGSARRWLCAEIPAAPHGPVGAVTIESGPVDWTRFGLWLGMLLNRHGARILRLKGLVAVAGADTPVVIQGVQHLVHPPRHLPAWPDGTARTRLVLIATPSTGDLLRRSYGAFTGARPVGGASTVPGPHAAPLEAAADR